MVVGILMASGSAESVGVVPGEQLADSFPEIADSLFTFSVS